MPIVAKIRNLINEKLSIPEILSKFSSSFSFKFIKNSCEAIKAIKGNISNIREGVFKKVKRTG